MCGFLLTTSISLFFIFFVFHKKPKNLLYFTVSVISKLSLLTHSPINCPSEVAQPCNSNQLSTTSIHRKTIVSPGKKIILSRIFVCRSTIVCICEVVIACKSRFFVCNVFINAISFARYFFNSDNLSSNTPTLTALRLSRVLYCLTSCKSISVFWR